MANHTHQSYRLTPEGMCEPAVPRCPECGGLECLCRPRFFAGQLLTEEDLNRLDHYIVEKNKLHNRYLHGWGTVCGLEVVCHPCSNLVTVRPGYALSPCGEDIIVCEEVTVDICAMIDRCRDRQPVECEPPRGPRDPGCREITEAWVLAIRYDERPSRGVTALRGATGSACCTRCACGGSSACGCSCHKTNGNGKSNGSFSNRPPQRATPLQCEPTLTCEGYQFEIYKAPPEEVEDPGSSDNRPFAGLKGPMGDRMRKCLQGLIALWPPYPNPATPQALHEWCCRLKENMLDFFDTYGTYDCKLLQDLVEFVCPDPEAFDSPSQYQQAFNTALARLVSLVAEPLRYCICSALLPPCPEPVCDPRVPLATVLVQRDGCRVLRVCNWGPRRFVVTFPTLGYWLSPLQLGETIRQLLIRLCCVPFQIRTPGIADLPNTPPGVPTDTPGAGVPGGGGFTPNPDLDGGLFMAAQQPNKEVPNLLLQSWANRQRTIDARTLFLGAVGFRDERNQPVMSDLEARHPVEFLLANQVLRPAVDAKLPDAFTLILETLAGAKPGDQGGVPGFTPAPAEEVATLKAQMAEMREMLQQQAQVIEELRGRG